MTKTANLNKLSKTEKLWYQMMNAKGAVPFIKSRPGEAKTAIIRSIAKKLGYQLIDIRLSQIDEVVVTGFPTVDKDSNTYSFKAPDWAIKANQKPTIIVFEELNRARLEQRNAAMQIMCEREVGMNLKLNDDVLLIATGNLGEDDGTDVEEIESAQRGRLATIYHNLTIEDWEKEYAKANVHPLILNFIKTKPEYFYRYEGDDADNYASPRSWSYLSRFLTENEITKDQIIDTLMAVGKSYVGSSITPLIRYAEQMQQISAKNILDKYDEVREIAQKFSRPQISEYLANLGEYKIEKLGKKKIDNLIAFLKDIKDDDELVSFFVKLLKQLDYGACVEDPKKMAKTQKILNEFPEVKKRMKSYHQED